MILGYKEQLAWARYDTSSHPDPHLLFFPSQTCDEALISENEGLQVCKIYLCTLDIVTDIEL